MINLKDTYIENDNGKLRDAYLIEAHTQGYTVFGGGDPLNLECKKYISINKHGVETSDGKPYSINYGRLTLDDFKVSVKTVKLNLTSFTLKEQAEIGLALSDRHDLNYTCVIDPDDLYRFKKLNLPEYRVIKTVESVEIESIDDVEVGDVFSGRESIECVKIDYIGKKIVCVTYLPDNVESARHVDDLIKSYVKHVNKWTFEPVPYEFKHGDKCIADTVLPGIKSPVFTFCCLVPDNPNGAIVMVNDELSSVLPASHLKLWSGDDHE